MSEPTVTVIDARPASLWGRVAAAWRFRHYYPVLLKELALRRFRNTILGVWWLVLRPLIPMVIIVLAFTRFVTVDTGELPYALFFVSAYIGWNLFQSTVTFMSRTLMWSKSLMRKMYLPKMIIPAASIGPPMIELAITCIAFAGLAAFFYFQDGVADIAWSWRILLAIPTLMVVLLFALSIGAVFSVIALLMRDIIFSIGWVIQAIMFATPVIYPMSSIPAESRWIFHVFNPMAGLVETMRWSLTGFGTFEPLWFAVSILQVAICALLCFTFFARAETYLADVV